MGIETLETEDARKKGGVSSLEAAMVVALILAGCVMVGALVATLRDLPSPIASDHSVRKTTQSPGMWEIVVAVPWTILVCSLLLQAFLELRSWPGSSSCYGQANWDAFTFGVVALLLGVCAVLVALLVVTTQTFLKTVRSPGTHVTIYRVFLAVCWTALAVGLWFMTTGLGMFLAEVTCCWC